MLNTLNRQTLENRRIKSSLILLFKTKCQLVAIDHFCLTETRNLNFFVSYSRTKYHMNSFSLIKHWNSLPYSPKASPSLSEFTTGLATVKSVYVFNCRKCRVVNFIIIYDHPCLNKHPFSSFSSFSPTAPPSNNQ